MKHHHHLRHAFILFPGVGILLEKYGLGLGHKEMLMHLGFSGEQVSEILERVPRGYYMAGTLCFYQGKDFKPLTPENEEIARFFWPDLKQMLNLSDNVRVYSGMIVGKLGDHWAPMNLLDLRERGE